jgi:hypothetical protein
LIIKRYFSPVTIVFCDDNGSINEYKRKLLHLHIQKSNTDALEAMLPLSSGVKCEVTLLLTLKVEAACSSKAPASAYKTSCGHKPKNHSLKNGQCKNPNVL